MLRTFNPAGSIEDISLGQRWEPAKFAQAVNRRAIALAEMNIRRGSIVGIYHCDAIHFLIDLFATWRLGAAAACVDSSMKDKEIRQIIRLATPSILLVDRPLTADVDSIPVLEFNAISDRGGSIPAI